MGFGKRLKKALKKVTKPVTSVTAPVTKPVTDTLAPVTKPVESAFSTVTDKSTYDTAGEKVGGAVRTGWRSAYGEYDRYTSSKTGAYLTPYLTMYDSDGRAALRDAYGGYAAAGASVYNPAAGAVVGAGLAAYDAHNAPGASVGGGGTAFAPPGDAPVAMETPSDGVPLWLIAVGAIAAVGAVFVVVAIVKGRK